RHRLARAEIVVANGVTVHRRIVVRRDVDRRDDVFREHAPERSAHAKLLDAGHRIDERTDDFVRFCDRQRVRVVVADAADRLSERAHFSFAASSSSVLKLEKASASSSKATSTTLSVAYQASILRPPSFRKSARWSSTPRRMSENTGWGCSPVFATASSAPVSSIR